MQTTELELTYLAKYIPEGLEKCPYKDILTVGVPAGREHPDLRLRKVGDRYEITRKTMAHGTDSSKMIEQTIDLDAEEFAELTAGSHKRSVKRRYYYPYKNLTAEVDVFGDDLQGLVMVDVEFTDRDQQLAFGMPDFCLADVTQEEFLAGGMLVGKRYEDIRKGLEVYTYQPLTLRH